MLISKVLLLCSILLAAFVFEETEAWGRIRFRLPRIRLPRIRLPRIRLPRIRLPRLSSLLPRLRIPCFLRPSFSDTLPYLKSPLLGNVSFADDEACSVIVPRSDWGADTLKESAKTTLPMKTIGMYIRGDDCQTTESCTVEAKKLYSDGGSFNFMIGGDGTVFEGRGWYNVSNPKGVYSFTEYGFCFIGQNTTDKMFTSFIYLVECGKSKGVIASSLGDDDFVERL